jgi:ubiquinone/menaquinone biosynthesis C-methylase UbiE
MTEATMTESANSEGKVQEHYGRGGLLARLDAALTQAGLDPARATVDDLVPFDQLHGRGIAATREHAERAGIDSAMHVLDLGCGIGGASRYLAATCGCRVTAIDLTAEFIAVARVLTARSGLADRITYRRASALALPFADGIFDHVWCHNVTMNIPDKAGFAAEVARVLKPQARFSCAEVALGPAGAPSFPLPWATDPSASFLVTPAEMKAALEQAGLRVIEQSDLTAAGLDFARAASERAKRGEKPVQANGIVMGEDFLIRARNSNAAMRESRLVEQFILAEKA